MRGPKDVSELQGKDKMFSSPPIRVYNRRLLLLINRRTRECLEFLDLNVNLNAKNVVKLPQRWGVAHLKIVHVEPLSKPSK